MSQAQKREAGERLLRLTDWSNSEIARRLAVSEGTIRNWRDAVLSSQGCEDMKRQYVKAKRGDQEYWMDVTDIRGDESKKTQFNEHEELLFGLANSDCVYLFHSNGKHKIGRTNDLRTRAATFRTSNPDIELLWAIPTEDPIEAEREIQERFAAFHVDGEWYKLPHEAVQWFMAQSPITVTRNGTTYTMDVSNIGNSAPGPDAVTELEAKPEAAIPLDFERLLDEEDEPDSELCAHCTWNNRANSWVCLKTDEIWPVDALAPPCAYCDMYLPESEQIDEPEEEQSDSPDLLAVHHSSKTSQHYTPQCIIDATLACLGEIDLDPCSNSNEQPNVPAKWHHTPQDDGLSHRWAGRVYMNPPYGSEISKWIDKLCLEHEEGDVSEAIALVAARPDTQWWHRLRDYPVCFITGRLTFVGNDNPAPFPSAVFYLGKRRDAFYRVFSELGDCWQRMMPGISFGE